MRFLLKLLAIALVFLGFAVGGVWWWSGQPLVLTAPSVEMTVPARASLRTVVDKAEEGGVRSNATLLYWFFRAASRDQTVKPGDYEVTQGMTPRTLLDKLIRGERIVRSVTFIEGWTFRQLRDALAKAKHLKPDTAGMSGEQIMAALGRAGVHPEGRFFPDTYNYQRDVSDLTILKQSMQLMDKRLAEAWAERRPDTPLKSPDELLRLASIIEKETGLKSDRPMVAGVFVNRLRVGMPLQTDPTVIYGLGEKFDGNLRKRDLQTDTPYNTYTRRGLPPTPIALPGRASLMAAVKPADTKALYFVSRGDGSSQFSPTLQEHNRAVDKYIRGRGGN